jgi:hypothetical protein
MNVTFRCPHCGHLARVEVGVGEPDFACPHCQAKWPITPDAAAENLPRCLVCPSTELFTRKDFSQRLGVAIVIVGVIVSSVFWAWRMPLWTYGVLFATALVDVVLYLTVGNVLECYRCHAQYRGAVGTGHEPFDLETHEKHRQQKIRMKAQQSAARSV